MPSLPAKMKILLILTKIFWKIEIKLSRSALFHIKTRCGPKYPVKIARRATRETGYHASIAEPLKRSLYSQIAELVRKTRTMFKIFSFSEGQKFSQTSPGIKLLHDRGKNPFIYWPRRHNLGTGRQFQQIYWPRKPPGRISLGHLDRVY